MRTHSTLRILRERAGLSQADLARILGRGQPEVSMWEWGKEHLPDPIRHQIFGVLRDRLGETDSLVHMIRPEDLDRPWDQVLDEGKTRATVASALAADSDDKEPPSRVS